jgi:pimeloyl-ACP methyl ester carboxylesterase
VTTLLLIHGGLWEDMDAERFWRRPGITGGLERRGFTVIAPDRPRRAPSWAADAEHVASFLSATPVTVVAGSNGCSVAVRLALEHPRSVSRLLLAWPAGQTAPGVRARIRSMLASLGAPPATVEALTGGETLPCATDQELATLSMPAAVIPSPPNPYHHRDTDDSLLRLLPHAMEFPGCPESPRPEFPPHLESLLDSITAFAGLPGQTCPFRDGGTSVRAGGTTVRAGGTTARARGTLSQWPCQGDVRAVSGQTLIVVA